MALARPIERYIKENRLNWKLKVSNTADNAGITQSQARETMVSSNVETKQLVRQ